MGLVRVFIDCEANFGSGSLLSFLGFWNHFFHVRIGFLSVIIISYSKLWMFRVLGINDVYLYSSFSI